MDPVYLAYPVKQDSNTGQLVFDVLYYFPIPSAIVLGILLIGIVWLRSPTPSSSDGPPLPGTAQVLSLGWTKTVERKRYVAQIELQVHTPGGEPYVAVVNEPLGPKEVKAGVQPGGTVAVAVDSANPHNVRLEPPYGAPPLTPAARRLRTIGFWILGVGVTAVIVIVIVAGIVAGHLFPFSDTGCGRDRPARICSFLIR